MGLFDFLKRGKKADKNVEPDSPCPFGYNTCWYAIKNETTQTVIDKLHLKVLRESNWINGIAGCGSPPHFVFVSPPLDGYVFVININPDDEHEAVKKHAGSFGEFQYFGTQRTVEYNAWAKFMDGKIIRSYCYLGERGEITWCEGSITDEEVDLGFDVFPSSTGELLSDDFNYQNLPNEEDVLAIAKAWGVDTKFEEKTYEKGIGFTCKFTN